MTSCIMIVYPPIFAYQGFTMHIGDSPFRIGSTITKPREMTYQNPSVNPSLGPNTVYSLYPLVIPSFSLTLVDGFMGLHVNIWDFFVGVHDLFVGIMA